MALRVRIGPRCVLALAVRASQRKCRGHTTAVVGGMRVVPMALDGAGTGACRAFFFSERDGIACGGEKWIHPCCTLMSGAGRINTNVCVLRGYAVCGSSQWRGHGAVLRCGARACLCTARRHTLREHSRRRTETRRPTVQADIDRLRAALERKGHHTDTLELIPNALTDPVIVSRRWPQELAPGERGSIEPG